MDKFLEIVVENGDGSPAPFPELRLVKSSDSGMVTRLSLFLLQ